MCIFFILVIYVRNTYRYIIYEGEPLIILEYDTKKVVQCRVVPFEAHYIYRWAMIFHCLKATTWLYGTARYVLFACWPPAKTQAPIAPAWSEKA